MEADSWSRFSSAASKRHQSALQSRYDLYLGFEEIDGVDDDYRAEFPCPFCSEDFDVVGLCCHIDDEHPVEAKNGVCPVCAARVGLDLVAHITTQHGSFFRMQRRRRFRRGSPGSHSMLSLLRRDLREGNLQSLLGGSSYMAAPSSAAPDPFLSSLIYTLPVAESSREVQPESLDEANMINKSSDEKVAESLPRKDERPRCLLTEWNHLYLRKIRKRELGGVNLCGSLFSPQYLMTHYEGILLALWWQEGSLWKPEDLRQAATLMQLLLMVLLLSVGGIYLNAVYLKSLSRERRAWNVLYI